MEFGSTWIGGAISFLAGGGAISLLMVIAERAPRSYRGLVVSLPSTVMVSFLIFGFSSTSFDAMAHAPITLAGLGCLNVFVVAYASVAAYLPSGRISVPTCAIASTVIWFVGASLVVNYVESEWLSVGLVYGACSIGALFLLKKMPFLENHVSRSMPSSWLGNVVRAGAAGGVVMVTYFLGRNDQIGWAAAFSVFPAAGLASLVLLHWKHGKEYILPVAKVIPLGSMQLAVYVLVVAFSMPVLGVVWGNAVAFISSLLTFLLLTRISNFIYKELV